MLVICSFREGEVQFKAFAKCRNTDFLRNLQTARKGRRSFVVVSKFSFSHPPTIPWGFNTHGWAYNFISPGLARNHHAHPRPAARTPPASNASARPSHRPAPGPATARPSPRTGPHTARPARLHDAQPRFHEHAQDPQAQYGFTSGCFSRTALRAPNRPGPARARTADSDNARAELG